MSNAFVRVTVIGPAKQVDVSLPMDRPVTEMLPVIMHMTDVGAPGADRGAWSLSTPSSGELDTSVSPEVNGLRDGASLYLTRSESAAEPAFVDDVLHRLGRSSLSDFSIWRGTVRRRTTAVMVGSALAAASVTIAVAYTGIGAAIAVVMLGIASVGAAITVKQRDGGWLGWSAIPSFASGGAMMGSELSGVGMMPWLLVGASLGFAMVGVLGLSAPRIVGLIGLATAILLAAAGVAIELGASAVATSAWSLIPLLAVLAYAPKLAMASSGVVSMVRRSEEGDAVHRDEMRMRLEFAQQATDAMVWAASVLIASACVVLAVDGVWIQGVLAPFIAVVLVLHSRSFTHSRHVVPLIGAAVIAGTAGALALPRWFGVHDATGAAVSVIVIAIAGLGTVLLNVVQLDKVSSARLTRFLNALDYPVVLGIVPLIFAAQGVYQLYWPS